MFVASSLSYIDALNFFIIWCWCWGVGLGDINSCSNPTVPLCFKISIFYFWLKLLHIWCIFCSHDRSITWWLSLWSPHRWRQQISKCYCMIIVFSFVKIYSILILLLLAHHYHWLETLWLLVLLISNLPCFIAF